MTFLIPPPGLLRLILACIVVAAHYASLSRTPVYVLADSAAVVGFFFFSGYWVARLWDRKYVHCRAPLLTFYISRAVRIFPLAILATFAMAAVTPVELSKLIWNLLLFGVQYGSAFNPPAWSLAVELQFYAIAPFLFIWMANRRMAILILAVSFCAWIVFAANWMPPTFAGYVLVFALGIAYARFPRPDWAARLAPLGPATFLLVMLIPNLFPPPLPLDSLSRFLVIAASMVILPYIAASLSRQSDRRDRIFGDLAYPVYLFHWPVFLMAAKLTPEYSVGLALFLTAVISLALLWLVDRPLEKMRHAFVSGRIRQQPEQIADSGTFGSMRAVD